MARRSVWVCACGTKSPSRGIWAGVWPDLGGSGHMSFRTKRMEVWNEMNAIRLLSGKAALMAAVILGLGLGAGFPAKAAEKHPDFTGVWTAHRIPGGPRVRASLAERRPLLGAGQEEDRGVSRADRSDRRNAGRLLRRDRHARKHAELGRLSDGDHPAARTDYGHLRGLERAAAHLYRRQSRSTRRT